MAVTWIFSDGVQSHPCTSFPFAFRSMFYAHKKGIESGKTSEELTKKFKITSPVGTVYNYRRASELAIQQGLLTTEGTINSREFKRK